MKKIGFTWLVDHLDVRGFLLTHESYIGTTYGTEISLDNTVIQTYKSKSKYDIDDENPLLHLEFALKYDDLNLALLTEIFNKIEHQTITEYVSQYPNRKYPRIIGFFYEFLGFPSIPVRITISNYEDALDDSRYYTGISERNSKWKINNNLLGTPYFCPIIRKTTQLQILLNWDISATIDNLEEEYSPILFRRASNYLYKKESKTSSEIEQEKLSPDRLNRFILLLEEAGRRPFEEALSERELTRLQNAIVDPRYADNGFRNFQNYVGQTLLDYSQKIHYVCPPPQLVASLMNGLALLEKKNENTLIKATMTSFGFVYVHPFEDGNGRIHRFLIHDILVRDGVVPSSTIIPVSAQILAQMNEYDRVLETLSKLVNRKTQYSIDDNGELTVNNVKEIEHLYRFPELTEHAAFLAKAIQDTLTINVTEELLFLKRYDELKRSIALVVDMPDQRIDRLILYLHQNKGQLAKRKRKHYQELTEEEITQMEQAYQEVFIKQKS